MLLCFITVKYKYVLDIIAFENIICHKKGGAVEAKFWN